MALEKSPKVEEPEEKEDATDFSAALKAGSTPGPSAFVEELPDVEAFHKAKYSK